MTTVHSLVLVCVKLWTWELSGRRGRLKEEREEAVAPKYQAAREGPLEFMLMLRPKNPEP